MERRALLAIRVRLSFFVLRYSSFLRKLKGMRMLIAVALVLVFGSFASLMYVTKGSPVGAIEYELNGSTTWVPDDIRAAQPVITATNTERIPTPGEVMEASGVHLLLSLKSYAQLEDWSLVSKEWTPTPESCVYWMKHRIKQVRRIVGDDAKKAADRGWKREWPPYEGFPTEEDYIRVSLAYLPEFVSVIDFKTYRAYVQDALAITSPGAVREQLGALDQAYDKWTEAAWMQVGCEDAYLGWNDLMRMGHRMEIE